MRKKTDSIVSENISSAEQREKAAKLYIKEKCVTELWYIIHENVQIGVIMSIEIHIRVRDSDWNIEHGLAELIAEKIQKIVPCTKLTKP